MIVQQSLSRGARRERRTPTWAAVGLSLAAAVAMWTPAARVSAVTPDVCPSGCTHTSISAAVAAASANDTIVVGTGIYVEPSMVIDKPLTIQGAGAGATVVDGGGASTSATPGVFRILPPASGAVGPINLSGMTIRNPSLTGSVRFVISIGIKAVTTPVTAINLDHLEIVGSTISNGYGIYADGGVTGGVDRTAPPLTLTNSVVRDQSYNGIGVDAYRGKVTIADNELFEGTAGVSGVLVMNEYTQSRMPDDVIVTRNVSHGRLVSVRNDVPSTPPFGGYDSITITDNTIGDLGANDFAIRVGSNAVDDGPRTAMGPATITGNTITGDGAQTTTVGVQLLGVITKADVADNDITGVGVGVQVALNNGLGPVSGGVVVLHDRLFADTIGISNNTAAVVSAKENWWGCQAGPASGSSYCSPVANTGSGSVDTSSWVVTTATASAGPSIDAGDAATVNGTLGSLNTGAAVPLPALFAGLPVAFSADRGVVAPASGVLDGSLAASSTYTAPAASGADTAWVTIDQASLAGGVVTGEPVPVRFEVAEPPTTEPPATEPPSTSTSTTEPSVDPSTSEPEVAPPTLPPVEPTQGPPSTVPELPVTGGAPGSLAAAALVLLAAGIAAVAATRRRGI